MSVTVASVNHAQAYFSLRQTNTAVMDNVTPRQDVATIATEKQSPRNQSDSTASNVQSEQQINSQQQENFLNQLMEQMLANRIGLDKQKYDEIKQKIEDIELEKAALAEQEQSPARDSKIALLEDKQAQLNQSLVELVEQAKRNREQNERAEQAKSDLIDQYRIAAYTSPKTATIL